MVFRSAIAQSLLCELLTVESVCSEAEGHARSQGVANKVHFAYVQVHDQLRHSIRHGLDAKKLFRAATCAATRSLLTISTIAHLHPKGFHLNRTCCETDLEGSATARARYDSIEKVQQASGMRRHPHSHMVVQRRMSAEVRTGVEVVAGPP